MLTAKSMDEICWVKLSKKEKRSKEKRSKGKYE